MRAIDKIEVRDGKYIISFRYDEGQILSIEYTHDEFHAMLNLVKQAAIAHAGQTVAIEKEKEITVEEVRGMLDRFKTNLESEIVGMINDNNKILKTDYEYIRDIVNKVESERSSLLLQINSSIKTQLDNVQTLIESMKKIEERSYSTVLSREAEVARVIDQIKKKNDASNANIEKMRQEIEKSKEEIDHLKTKELKRIEDIIKRQTAIIEAAHKTASIVTTLEYTEKPGFFARIKGLFGK